MRRAVPRISRRRIQLWLRSIARLLTRSTSRPRRAASSSSIVTWSRRLQSASGAKVTSRSMSLAGPKSSRRAEPKRDNSTIRQRSQKAASISGGKAMAAALIVVSSPAGASARLAGRTTVGGGAEGAVLLSEEGGAGGGLAGVLGVALLAVGDHDGGADGLEGEGADPHPRVEGDGHAAEVAQFHGGGADPAGLEDGGGGVDRDAEAGD